MNAAGIEPLDDHLQPGPIQWLFVVSIFTIMELSLLQPLAPDAVATAIKVEDLHLGLFAVDEDEEMAGEWIFFKLLLYQY